MHQQQRHHPPAGRRPRPHVQEVDVETSDPRHELGEGVEQRLLLPPGVRVVPVGRNLPQVLAVEPVPERRVLQRPRQPPQVRRDARPQVREVGVCRGHTEGSDVLRVRGAVAGHPAAARQGGEGAGGEQLVLQR